MPRNPEFDQLEEYGVFFPEAQIYAEPTYLRDYNLAMDAQPLLVSVPNNGIPAYLTTVVDPKIIRIVMTPNKGAEIYGEERRGTWLDDTVMFTTIERTGETSAYGDYSMNGTAGVNIAFPQRQAFLYQTIIQYGDREMERVGLARIGYAAELRESAAYTLNKYQNYTYHFGVAGLQNYGMLNDPYLSAAITPAPKAAAGNSPRWIVNNTINGTANEIYNDVISLVAQLVAQSNGAIDSTSSMTLVMSPAAAVALTATNIYGVNVTDLLKKNFPGLRIEVDPLYGAQSAVNPQGIAAGNIIQLIADTVEGQKTGICGYNEKFRAHPIRRELSAFAQKFTQGTWGAVITQPFAVAQMVGV